MPLSGGSAVVRSLLVRGMLAGLAAGVVAFVFAYFFGEPAVNGGIAFEEQLAAASGAVDGGEPLVSRGIQSTVGLLTGVLIYAVAVGGILALVHAATRGRFGPARPRAAALVLAAIGFVAVILVPFLKYPGNPPASSDDGSIGQRTGLYVVMVLFSVLVAVLATALGRVLAARLGTWNGTIAAVGAYLLVVLIGGALLPVVDETPADFPATVLYDFRIASLGLHVVLWATLGLVFGALAERTARRGPEVLTAR